MMDHEDDGSSQNENKYQKDVMGNNNNNKHQSQLSNASAYSNQSKSMITETVATVVVVVAAVAIEWKKKDSFERAVINISCYNANPKQVFNTLQSVAKKLLKDDKRYRTLDTTNPKVEKRLFGYEGIVDFLLLLGFDSDVMGQRLVCKGKLDQEVIRTAIQALDIHEYKTKAAVNTDSAMLASGIQSLDRSINNSINANNDDDNESDGITIQQI
ncbi:hypothetical protein RFI_38829, partial [Reticulomyxa filosa]